MKKLSIVGKLTLWYTIILLIISIGSMVTISHIGKNQVEDQTRATLVEQVADASEEIKEAGRHFEVNRSFRFYKNDVYISIYDVDHVLIEGRWPPGVPSHETFADKEMDTIKGSDGADWFIYDSLFSIGGRDVWVRGITRASEALVGSSYIKRATTVILPVLILLAIVVGRIIAGRALKPVRNMNETVKEIRNSGNLKKRVKRESDDEMGTLASNFNELFDQVEDMVNKEKRFTADVSHELRTPISVIRSQSEYALEDEEYRERALETISRESKRMAELINRLQLLSRSDSGNLKLDIEEVDLSDMCTSLAEQQGLIAQKKGIVLTADIQEDIKIKADVTMIIRVLLNLLDNAIKYTKENGAVKISLETKDGDIICSVSDTGIGISQEHIDKVWDRFYRVDESRSSQDSSGLGLSMVKAIVEAHGGKTFVRSVPEEGSTFGFILKASA